MALTAKERAANRKRAKQMGRIDKNGDGVFDVDPLEREKLAAEYKQAIGIIYAVPEIQPIFEKAVKQGWAVSEFIAKVRSSDWYLANNEYSRLGWAAESIGGADWLAKQQDARSAVQSRATQRGASLTPAELDALARRFIYEGWDQPTRTGLLDKALSEEITYLPDDRGKAGFKGEAGNFVDRLKNAAYANGLTYSDGWYQAAARAVNSDLGTEEDYLREITEQAAGKWAPWAQKIRGGMSAYEIASPYINEMAQTLELSPVNITLDDPFISQALMGIDDKGNAAPMSLWDFKRKLRNDPRWMNTDQAQNQVSGTASAVMRMFGLRG